MNFYTILTAIGKAKIANAQVTGTSVNLTHMAVGDGNGNYYEPQESQSALVNETWRGNINQVSSDPENPNWIIIEAVIPTTDGGFTVREAGIFDDAGDLIAVGKYPETYKPVLEEGSAKDLYIRMILEVSNASVVNLKIDPAVVLASRAYVDAHEAKPAPHSGHETPGGAQAKVDAAWKGAGTNAVALGKDAEASGYDATAVGHLASASGDGASAFGMGANASGTNAVALGWEANASGYDATAVGHFTSASGDGASAFGMGAIASGTNSVALGIGAKATADYQGVLGGAEPTTTNTWLVPGSFSVSGTKNFEIPHPNPAKKETHLLRHGSVESPSPGETLYRWKIDAKEDHSTVTIPLPDYFIYLNGNVQIFVTGQGHFGNGYGVYNEVQEELTIHCQLAGEYNVLAIGTRKDDHKSVREWGIKGVERRIDESWNGESQKD